MINLPNALSALRILLVPVLLTLAWTGRETAFLAVLACSLLSDLLDGFAARALDQASELGARLDSWGDFGTFWSVPLCAWWLWPDLILRELVWVGVVIAAYFVPTAIGLLKYRRLTSYHTWGAKASALLLGPAALLLFLKGPALPFHVAAAFLVVVEIEEVAMTSILPTWHCNVPTLWHAHRLTRPPDAAASPPPSPPGQPG